MDNKITGNEPAYPCQSDLHGKMNNGLTIRQHFAAVAMQGILYSMKPLSINKHSAKAIVTESLLVADYLITELNK